MAQLRRNFLQLSLLAYADRNWPGINLGRIGENRPLKTLSNNAFVMDVVIGEENGERYRQDKKGSQRKTQHGIATELSRPASSTRNSDSYGHVWRSNPWVKKLNHVTAGEMRGASNHYQSCPAGAGVV